MTRCAPAVAAFALLLGLPVSTALADNQYMLRPDNDIPGHPRLGCEFQVIAGYGYWVRAVFPGSPADIAGIERGDVIRSINGYPLTYHGAHEAALAQGDPSRAVLRIRDWRTRNTFTRWVNLYGGGGGVFSSH